MDDRQEQLAGMYQFYTEIRIFTAGEEKKQYIDKLGFISLELGGHIILFKLWHFQMRDSRCSQYLDGPKSRIPELSQENKNIFSLYWE